MFSRLARPALRAASVQVRSACSHLPLPVAYTETDRVALQTPISSAIPRFQTRALHRIPQLQNEKYYKENGIPEFMSPEGFDFAWTQYQNLLVDKLNLLTQGQSSSPCGQLNGLTVLSMDIRVTEY